MLLTNAIGMLHHVISALKTKAISMMMDAINAQVSSLNMMEDATNAPRTNIDMITDATTAPRECFILKVGAIAAERKSMNTITPAIHVLEIDSSGRNNATFAQKTSTSTKKHAITVKETNMSIMESVTINAPKLFPTLIQTPSAISALKDSMRSMANVQYALEARK